MIHEQIFMDVYLKMDECHTLSYRSGLTVYEESLVRGQYVSLGWNGAGYINSVITLPDIPSLKPDKFSEPQAFQIEVDGQSLGSHWEWDGFSKEQENEGLHAIVQLKHMIRPITVKIHTYLDGTPVIRRWLEIINNHDKPTALGSVKSWSGGLQSTERWKNHLHDNSPLYSIGYMEDANWGNEGNFTWHPLPNATYGISGRYLRNRHRHPMFVLRNEATGEHFIGQLAWSAGYTFSFDLNCDIGTADIKEHDMQAHLSFKVGPDGPAPLRVIAPFETVQTPEVHLGMVYGGLDNSIQEMHEHMRRSVFNLPLAHGKEGWIESAIGPEREMSLVDIYHQIDTATYLGVEVFFIDAGWYVPPHQESEWGNKVGDWEVDTDRYPGGIKPILEKVHENGMLFGLWMEPERFGKSSKMLQEHPDWIAEGYDRQEVKGRRSGLLDLGKPEVAKWVEEQIIQLIEENELDFFRIDQNVGNIKAGGFNERDGYIENNYWRYYENFDQIFMKLRKRFPDVIFENCASGGARSDLGTVKNFSHTWVTDWQTAPRSFSVTNGMTMALPPEKIDRLLAGQSGHSKAEINFQARQLLFSRPTLGMFNPPGSERNPVQLEAVHHMLAIYKKFVRPFINSSRIYHHTPELSGFEPKGWGILEMTSIDKTRGIAGIFQLSNPQENELVLRLRGLNLSSRYKVTWDNSRQATEIEGFVLMNQGLTIRLEGALTSELLLFESV